MRFSKIIVADDSDLLHRMYDLILMRYRMEGTQIIHAHDGTEAWSLCRRHPDAGLVLLDVNMPGMNGVDVVRRLRASGLLERMRAVMVSTEAKKAQVEAALAAGATAYVSKPLNPRDLHQVIENIFGRADDARAAGSAR